VLAAFRIMVEGPCGVIRVSEATHNLIETNPFIYDTLDMQEHHDVIVDEKVIKTYICDLIFPGLDSDDDESEEFEDSSYGKEDEL